MIQFLESLPPALLRSGLILTASVALICLVLRLTRVTSTTICRLAYFGTILQGIVLGQASITIPWLPPKSSTEPSVSVSQPIEIPTVEIWRNDPETVFELDTSTSPIAELSLQREDLSSAGVPWIVLLGIAWLSGVIAIIGRCAWNYANFLRNVSPCGECIPELVEEWKRLQHEFGFRVNIPLELSSDLGPMICRFPRGFRLIVPAAYWRELEPIQRTAVLRHELAHLQRNDVWKSLIVRILALPHWFNPLVWWIVRKFDECAEWACDEAARTASPDHVTNYARALLQLGNRTRSQALFMPSANGSSLSGRIRRLLSSLPRKDSNMKKMLLMTAVVAISLVSVFRIELSAEEAAVPKPATTDTGGPSTEKTPAASASASDPSAASTAVKAGPAVQAAVIDLAVVFKNCKEFERERDSKLKVGIAESDRKMKKFAEEIKSVRDSLNDLDISVESNRARAEELKQEGVLKQAEFDARRRLEQQRFMKLESELYRKIYNRVTNEVAEYAKERGIRVVRRKKKDHVEFQQASSSSDSRPEPASDTISDIKTNDIKWAKGATTEQPADILKWMQREVIYFEPVGTVDITEEIIKLLNEKDAAAQKAHPSEPPKSQK